jgi:two-component system, cell cycle response regulator DivK
LGSDPDTTARRSAAGERPLRGSGCDGLIAAASLQKRPRYSSKISKSPKNLGTSPSEIFNQDEMKFFYSLSTPARFWCTQMGIKQNYENVDSTSQRCVLIVDDEPLNLKLFTLTLIKRGYRVLQATDGYHGFVLAHDDLPDLIIMDVQLPKISGLEITRTLKDNAHTQNIPILIATAFLIDEEKIRESGCDGYMTKPFAMKDFIGLIESLLERKPQVVATD